MPNPRIAFYHHSRFDHHRQALEVFEAGLKYHGVRGPRWIEGDNPKPCDLAVFWSYKFPKVIEAQRATGADCLVLENAYLGDRSEHLSAGYNGLNGRADFMNEQVGTDRYDQWSHLLKQQHRGEYAVVMGQVSGDQSLNGMNFETWARWAVGCAEIAFRMPVFYRPHPLDPKDYGLPGIEGTLAEVLSGADVVITYNSNSGVDAVLAGCAVVSLDRGSMAWDVSEHQMVRRHFDRCRWLERLSYCQWSRDEIREGQAWNHLKARFHY